MQKISTLVSAFCAGLIGFPCWGSDGSELTRRYLTNNQPLLATGFAMSKNPDGYHIRTVPTKGERGMIDGFEIKVPCICEYEDYLRVSSLIDKGDYVELLREYPGASIRSLPVEVQQ